MITYDIVVSYRINSKSTPVVAMINAALAEIGTDTEIAIQQQQSLSLQVSRQMTPEEITQISGTICQSFTLRHFTDVSVVSFNERVEDHADESLVAEAEIGTHSEGVRSRVGER